MPYVELLLIYTFSVLPMVMKQLPLISPQFHLLTLLLVPLFFYNFTKLIFIVMSLSRQGLPNLEGSTVEGALKGGYILSDAPHPSIILVGTGSETQLCAEAKKKGLNVSIILI